VGLVRLYGRQKLGEPFWGPTEVKDFGPSLFLLRQEFKDFIMGNHALQMEAVHGIRLFLIGLSTHLRRSSNERTFLGRAFFAGLAFFPALRFCFAAAGSGVAFTESIAFSLI